ncbi:NAD-P-binding protein [Fomitopsis betulina]|nr:NAD-P-binding protein [Fomitopsis betulina]
MSIADSASQENQKVWCVLSCHWSCTSSGFGKRLVHAVLTRGDYAIATVRVREDFPLETVDGAARPRLHIVELDVTDVEASNRTKVDNTVRVWGCVDVLVNNAGTTPKSLLEEGRSTMALAQFNTNVTHVLPHMRDRRSGLVIFFGSRSVWKPDAVVPYSETLAADVSRFNVKVLLVAPGHFRTEKLHLGPYELEQFNKLWHKAKGDTDRAVEVIVDVARGEGVAAGRELPFWLLLGNATYLNAHAHRVGRDHPRFHKDDGRNRRVVRGRAICSR